MMNKRAHENRKIEVWIHAETEKALLVGPTAASNALSNVWIAKSMMEWERVEGAPRVQIEAPEWLIVKNRLDNCIID